MKTLKIKAEELTKGMIEKEAHVYSSDDNLMITYNKFNEFDNEIKVEYVENFKEKEFALNFNKNGNVKKDYKFKKLKELLGCEYLYTFIKTDDKINNI